MYWFVFLFWKETFPTVSLIGGAFSTEGDNANPTGAVVENTATARTLSDRSVSPVPRT
jgi:hypothetical protein